MVRQKVKVSVALSPEILEWVDKQIENRVFANRSHAVEYALFKLRKQMEAGEAGR
jgi:Arc/MetJ-type ribon-helix-helix transcriptional regulator